MTTAAAHTRVARHLDPAFARIVVGFDGSARAEEAIRQAAAIARATGADLRVAHVFDPAVAPRGAHGETARRDAESILDRGLHLARGRRRKASSALLLGSPAASLVRHAAAWWADLVCVGADAGFLEDGHIFGLVAATTLRDAGSSVLVARPAAGSRAAFPSRIVCAVDGTSTSMEAARITSALARETGAGLTLVHSVDVHGRGSGPGWVLERHAGDPDPLSGAMAIAEAESVQAARRVALGRPGPGIARIASEVGADLIATGSRGLHGLRRTLSGSVGDWLVRHARCSLLVVRPRDGGRPR